MTAKMYWDRLMNDALDGTISARDRDALDAYFDQYPEERILFERLRYMDAALHAAPADRVPVHLTKQVMGVVMSASPQRHNVHQRLSVPQVLLLVGTSSVFVVVVGLIVLAVCIFTMPTFTRNVFEVGLALALSAVEVGVDFAWAVSGLLRAIFSQPIAWIVVFSLAGIEAVWLWVMTKVFIPNLRIAVA